SRPAADRVSANPQAPGPCPPAGEVVDRDRALLLQRDLDHHARAPTGRERAVPAHSARPAQSVRPRRVVVPDKRHAGDGLGGNPAGHQRSRPACLRPARRAMVDRHDQERLREALDRDIRIGGTMSTLLGFAIMFAFVCVVIAMAFCTVRLLIGPSAQDRVLALDTLWMCAMLLALMLGIRYGSQVYFEAAMLIVLVGFASTVALAKFLMRGEIIE